MYFWKETINSLWDYSSPLSIIYFDIFYIYLFIHSYIHFRYRLSLFRVPGGLEVRSLSQETSWCHSIASNTPMAISEHQSLMLNHVFWTVKRNLKYLEETQQACGEHATSIHTDRIPDLNPWLRTCLATMLTTLPSPFIWILTKPIINSQY